MGVTKLGDLFEESEVDNKSFEIVEKVKPQAIELKEKVGELFKIIENVKPQAIELKEKVGELVSSVDRVTEDDDGNFFDRKELKQEEIPVEKEELTKKDSDDLYGNPNSVY